MLDAVRWCREDANAVQDTDALLDSCLSLLAPIGVSHVSYARTNLYGECSFKTNYADAWQAHYLEHEMIDNDPVIEDGMRDSILRCWPCVDRDRETAGFFETARAFGVPSLGAAVTFQTQTGLSVFSVAFEGTAKEWCGTLKAYENELNLTAMSFCIRAGQLKKVLHLTARERDVLRWTARGKTSWEIGQILGLTEGTVNQYSRVIMKKMNAMNRVECVTKAHEQGLLRDLKYDKPVI